MRDTVLALLIDATDQLRQRDVAVAGDLLQRDPELILQAHACLMTCENNRTLDDQ
jgi:hypothetical protein